MTITLSAFQHAAAYGDTDMVRKALFEGIDLHHDDDRALRFSAQNGFAEIVERLLAKGANIAAERHYALRLSAENGHTETVAVLLKNGADIHADEDYALYMAAMNGQIETVALLLENGADIHAKEDIAFVLAAERGHVETAACLLEHGADIHAQCDYALHQAAYRNHMPMVAWLLSNGADIYARGSSSSGGKSLQNALDQGHADMVALLAGAAGPQAEGKYRDQRDLLAGKARHFLQLPTKERFRVLENRDEPYFTALRHLSIAGMAAEVFAPSDWAGTQGALLARRFHTALAEVFPSYAQSIREIDMTAFCETPLPFAVRSRSGSEPLSFQKR